MTKIAQAREFAVTAHLTPSAKGKVTRKRVDGSTEPYSCHPIRVAEMVRDFGGSEDAQLAALLHDVLEDTVTTADAILATFGATVLALVQSLTDPIVGTRKEKNAAKIAALATAASETHLVKLADLLDNLRDTGVDTGFGGTFASETRDLLAVLKGPEGLVKLVTAATADLQARHDAREAARKAEKAAKVAAEQAAAAERRAAKG